MRKENRTSNLNKQLQQREEVCMNKIHQNEKLAQHKDLRSVWSHFMSIFSPVSYKEHGQAEQWREDIKVVGFVFYHSGGLNLEESGGWR